MLPKLPVSVSLLSAVVVQLACQAFKVVYYSIRRRSFSLSWFFTTGGMPSAHSALVSSLSVSVGLWNGFDSELFAVACVFSLIVIYDAIRLRGAVQHHAKALKALAALHPDTDVGELNEMIGHTLAEIAAGILAGAGAAVIVYLALSPLR